MYLLAIVDSELLGRIMAEIYYIPLARLELKTTLSKEQFNERLSSELSGRSSFIEGHQKNRKHFTGQLGENSFRVSKVLGSRNSFSPIIKGTLKEENEFTTIKIKMILKPATLAFLMFWVFFVVLFSSLQAETLSDILWPIGMVLFAYFITFMGFNSAAEKAINALKDLSNPKYTP